MSRFEYSNMKIAKLWDALMVIEHSLKLIREEGRHEFTPILALQLRKIFTDKDDPLYKYLTLEIYENDKPVEIENKELFQGITLNPIIKKSKYYYYSDNFIDEENYYNIYNFLEVGIFTDDKYELGPLNRENEVTVERLIKIYSNKNHGSHSERDHSENHFPIILRGHIYIHMLAKYTLDLFLFYIRQVPGYLDFLNEYDNREEYRSYNIYYKR